MTKVDWKRTIKQQTESIGTYREEFDSVIDALADILEQRDAAYMDFVNTGAEPVTEFVSDRGAVNLKKNPRLAVWMDLNNQALAFWKDLGLTAAGLKRINDSAMKPEKKESSLAEVLKKLGG